MTAKIQQLIGAIRLSPIAQDLASEMMKQQPTAVFDSDLHDAARRWHSGLWCRDGGKCHHQCRHGECFRKKHCEPLSGTDQVNPDWSWKPGADFKTVIFREDTTCDQCRHYKQWEEPALTGGKPIKYKECMADAEDAANKAVSVEEYSIKWGWAEEYGLQHGEGTQARACPFFVAIDT